jgi:hypothetical protein
MGYTKTHDPWVAGDPLHKLSARALNHIESQWDAIKSDVDAHNHDASYYPKTEADQTFFDAEHYQGRDADKLDGLELDEIVGAAIPIGGIVAWSGSIVDIPAGYGICDGTIYDGYPSPDLRDRFVIGAGGAFSKGSTGGSESNIAPTGSVTVASHALTTSELPSHRHVYVDQHNPLKLNSWSVNASYYQTLSSFGRTTGQQDDGGGASHGHPGSTIAFDGVERLPQYYTLVFIMRYA